MKSSFTLVKKSAAKAVSKAVGDAPTPGAFSIQDNEDGTFTVFGHTKGGNLIAIDDVAELAVSSDDTSVLTVDAPSGMSSGMHPVGSPPKLGTANIIGEVTWNDGSIGPFGFTWPISVEGTVDGVLPVPGVPVPR